MEGAFTLIFLIFLACFAGVLLFGAPYLPTLTKHQNIAFDLLDLKKGQTILELGVGDGKIAIYAANKGLRVIGYELNPVLFIVAKIRTFKYRQNVKIKLGNFWRADWPKADAIYVFLLPKYMTKLDEKCQDYKHKPFYLISAAFAIENKKVFKHKQGVFLYKYF